MVRSKDRKRSIGNPRDQGIDILLRAQRGIHLAVGIEILDRSIRQRDMMRTNLAGDFHSTRARFPDKSHASCATNVLAMHMMIAKFREQNIAHHNHFLAHGRPSRQPQQRAPVTFIHHAFADKIVVLAMIEHGNTDHARILERASHQLVVLNALTVVRNRHHPALR